MKRRRDLLWLIPLVLFLELAGCRGALGLAGVSPRRPSAERENLTVHAAASLTDSFHALGEAFGKEHEDATLLFNFSGSQQLAQQLVSGAPGDLFASADERQMSVAIEGGRVGANSVRAFAQNSLMVVVPRDNPADIEKLEELADPGLRLVLATPEVPVGYYTRLFLQDASAPDRLGTAYGDAVLANVSSLELNVRAVLTKVSLGEADAGIVYRSDVIGATEADVNMLHIPETLNVTGNYLIAPVSDGENPELSAAFVAFLRSSRGQNILQEYGFKPLPGIENE